MIKERKEDFFLKKEDLRNINSSCIWKELEYDNKFIRRVISSVKNHIDKKEGGGLTGSSIEHTIEQIGLSNLVRTGVQIKILKTNRLSVKCV